MTIIHNLGFPRIGKQRELKFLLEDYWNNKIDQPDFFEQAYKIQLENILLQKDLDLIPIGDFSFYDHVLDLSFALNHIPQRTAHIENKLDQYFTIARGQATKASCCHTQAGSLLKWFDTNYHYIVPELTDHIDFKANANFYINQIKNVTNHSDIPVTKLKQVLLSPVSYLHLCKNNSQQEALDFLPELTKSFIQLIEKIKQTGVQYFQIDEPILATDLEKPWQHAIKSTFEQLKQTGVKIIATSYFGELEDNLDLALSLSADVIHIDALELNEAKQASERIAKDKILSLGIINGRNIWKKEHDHYLTELNSIRQHLDTRLWLAPSCSLLHVPVALEQELNFDPHIKNKLSFAVEKLQELSTIKNRLNTNEFDLTDQQDSKNTSTSNTDSTTTSATTSASTTKDSVQNFNRASSFIKRKDIQKKHLNLPLFPTTTIGSFPQTKQIRAIRQAFKKNTISESEYIEQIHQQIKHCVDIQLEIDLDVLVHGEAERNDMVEYFGEQLNGFVFSQFGWVQSYGSRCVKPPIIYDTVSRKHDITVKWTTYAQSLTDKPVKGMLTGPVTILNWSFVRDDQPISQTCFEIAKAIAQEVLALEQAGIKIIQIDEAALREGLPLRKHKWPEYLDWAVNAFQLTANSVKDDTQIHTHMCYSDFNDIIEHIARLDADVITIEASRSDLSLFDAFKRFDYPNDIGPGVYDIHSPNLPNQLEIQSLIKQATQTINADQLWINPDCGLKTRNWEEVIPALKTMVSAAKALRKEFKLANLS